jgi:uncharacterized membrane protein YdbT with pleckstrin-like domain
MSYIDDNILPDEKLLYRTRKHYVIFLQPALWTVAAVFFFVNSNDYIVKAGLVFAAIACVFWLTALLNYGFSEFAITDKRILMREGFFLKHINDTRMTTIANIEVNQNPLGQILNYGVLIIKTYGGSDDPFMDIPKPFEFKKVLQLQLDKLAPRTPNDR